MAYIILSIIIVTLAVVLYRLNSILQNAREENLKLVDTIDILQKQLEIAAAPVTKEEVYEGLLQDEKDPERTSVYEGLLNSKE